MGASVLEHFSTLEDPGIERGKEHQLLDIVVLAICAVVCGEEGWEAIELFTRRLITRLYLNFQHQAGPSHQVTVITVRRTPRFVRIEAHLSTFLLPVQRLVVSIRDPVTLQQRLHRTQQRFLLPALPRLRLYFQ